MPLTKSTVLAFCLAIPVSTVSAAEPQEHEQIARGLRQAVTFFTRDVASHGGYLWAYSADLKKREGEARVTGAAVWVQPPGTPSVGMALLELSRATDDPFYFDAARDAAQALVQGQLRSGGWDYRIEFEENPRKKYAYRTDTGRTGARNTTTLDDNTTQSALTFLMEFDRDTKFQDQKVHEAVTYALKSLLKAQYPNGAWPQRYSEFPDPEKFPVVAANYPKTWSRTYPKKDYRTYYTFNDNSIADMVRVMFLASEVYNAPEYRRAALKAGDFIVLAQMPEPQPGWAQQYTTDMQPAWARKFEPPAVTGGESQGILRTLLTIYRETGDEKYLAPVPKALAWLKRSQRDDGRLARFYELQTNKPLYFTKDYQLTYSDADMPTHYGFIVSSGVDRLTSEYQRLKALPKDQRKPNNQRKPPRLTNGLRRRALALVQSLDKRGAWVEDGRLKHQDADDDTRRVIECRTFIRNINALSDYMAACAPLDRRNRRQALAVLVESRRLATRTATSRRATRMCLGESFARRMPKKSPSRGRLPVVRFLSPECNIRWSRSRRPFGTGRSAGRRPNAENRRPRAPATQR